MSHKMLLLTLIWFLWSSSWAAECPFDYPGTGECTLQTRNAWSSRYSVGPNNIRKNKPIELTVDVVKQTAEADFIIGFGSESNYFAIFVPYDGYMCLPCSGSVQSGDLFITPPRNQALRSPNTGETTTSQFGATSNEWKARAALVNDEDQTAEWDKLVGTPSNMGKNYSPIKLTIIQDRDADSTSVTITKGGVTSQATLSGTFGRGDELYLFLGIDDYSPEIFTLTGVSETEPRCCANSGTMGYGDKREAKLDRRCAGRRQEDKCLAIKGCMVVDCKDVYQDEDGEYWIITDNILMRYGYDVMYAIGNNDILYYGLGVIVLGLIVFMVWRNRYCCSQYKQLNNGDDAMKPLLRNNAV